MYVATCANAKKGGRPAGLPPFLVRRWSYRSVDEVRIGRVAAVVDVMVMSPRALTV